MRPIEMEIRIPAPPEEVWAELERLEDHVEWMADAVGIEFHGDQRRGIGTSFACATKIGPLRTTDEMTITEWEEGRSMAVSHAGAVSGVGRFALSPADGGTTLTWTEQLRFPIWLGGPVGSLLARPIFRLVWRGNLGRLSERVVRGRS